MKTTLLPREELRAAYVRVSGLYPHVPSIALWRAWELAAYRRCALADPVLDLGCGDGAFFRLAWPGVRDAVGVDFDLEMVGAARASGVYREVHVLPAQEIDLPSARFRSVFANCSIEHMADLARVLANVARVLQPGGAFVLSVVTEMFEQWEMLPLLAAKIGAGEHSERLRREYRDYQSVRNPLTPEGWRGALEAAGFIVEEHFPLAPELTARLFLFLDALWHARSGEQSAGAALHAELVKLPGFPRSFGTCLDAVLDLEPRPQIGAGAVFRARLVRPGGAP